LRIPNLRIDLALQPKILVRNAQIIGQDVLIGDVVTLQEVRLNLNGLRMSSGPDRGIRVQEATVTMVATEKSLNDLLKVNPPEGTRDLSLATLTGRVRIEGKVVWNRIPVPFTLTAVPEVEGGARLRLNVQQVQVLGPIALPGFVSQSIGNKINDTLAEKFDITKLPIQARLTGLIVEPGRILLSATASIDITQAALEADSETTELAPQPS
jgi:hypothetical protein